jgi:hypothetical protein
MQDAKFKRRPVRAAAVSALATSTAQHRALFTFCILHFAFCILHFEFIV